MITKALFLIRCLTVVLGLLFIQSCATVPVQPMAPPFDRHKIDHILAEMRHQEGLVHTFYAKGRLTVRERDEESDSNVDVFCTKDPLKMKIEVTHPWGRPILHFLIQSNQISILSFPEKRLYSGRLDNFDSSKYFPGKLKPDQIWSILRGFPILETYAHAVSMESNQVTLLGEHAEILQLIDFKAENDIPNSASFYENDLEVSFSDFETNGAIQYSRNIRLNNFKEDTNTVLKYKKMVFNKAVPSAIFELERPSNFKIVPIDSMP